MNVRLCRLDENIANDLDDAASQVVRLDSGGGSVFLSFKAYIKKNAPRVKQMYHEGYRLQHHSRCKFREMNKEAGNVFRAAFV